jgi:hypothetical protein
MKIIGYIKIMLLVFILSAFFASCSTPETTKIPSELSPTPISTQTITPQPPTIIPTTTQIKTETPAGPVSYIYEGVSTYCSCIGCMCITNLQFTVRLTIGSNGHITGTFDKYLPQSPAMELDGVIAKITGSFTEKADGTITDFVGSLSKDLRILNVTLSSKGPWGTGTRNLYLSRK